MLSIDRLTIRLPAGAAGEAEPLARLVADRLATVEVTEAGHVPHLALPPVPAGTTDEVASRIAAAVAASLERGR